MTKSAISILSTILLAVSVASSQQNAGFHVSPEIRVQVIQVPDIPLTISQAKLEVESGINVYRLKFKIKDTGTSLKSIRLLILAASADDSVKGGETLCQAEVPAPGKERKYVIPLATKFTEDADHAILSFLQVKQIDGEQRTIGAKQVLAALSTKTDLVQDSLISNSAVPDLLCDRTFCSDCVQLARDVCTKGVHSVQCIINTCSCSFVCN